MSLDNESRQAMITYRQEKANTALDDAAFLTDAGRYNLAANRLYRHSGLITQIHMNFVKSGILTANEGGLFKVLFDLRHEGDYEDFIDVDRLDIEEYTPQVRKLVEKLIHLIE